MRARRLLTACSLSAVLLGAAASAVDAQVRRGQAPFETRQELQTKERDLQDRLSELDRGSDERAAVERDLSRVRERLEEGDFRPGDAVQVRVPGSDTLSGTFRVEPGPRLHVSTIGAIDLDRILYAEADSVIREELRRYVRDDRIYVRPLKRVAVLGAVGEPGYYDVPPSMTISDLLMEAGGPTQRSDLDRLELRRDGRRVASAEEGLRESATLAELAVERGDHLRVPQERGGSSLGTILSVVGAASGLAFAVSRVF